MKVWKMKLRKNYDNNFAQFESYDRCYNLAERLGFESAQEAWEVNPIIQGSVHPEDFKIAAS